MGFHVGKYANRPMDPSHMPCHAMSLENLRPWRASGGSLLAHHLAPPPSGKHPRQKCATAHRFSISPIENGCPKNAQCSEKINLLPRHLDVRLHSFFQAAEFGFLVQVSLVQAWKTLKTVGCYLKVSARIRKWMEMSYAINMALTSSTNKFLNFWPTSPWRADRFCEISEATLWPMARPGPLWASLWRSPPWHFEASKISSSGLPGGQHIGPMIFHPKHLLFLLR